LTEIAPLDADMVKRDLRLSLVSVPSLGYGALTINTGQYPKAETPLGRDARVRHAFELALDRDVLSQVVYGGLYQPNAQATSALSPLYVEEVAPSKRDVVKARALLQQAGVGTPLSVPLIVYNTPQNVQAGEVIQSMAADAGFAVQVNAMEFGAAIAAVQRGDFAVALGGWSGLLDTDSNAWSFLHTGGALNMARYSNATVDALLDRARAVSETPQRREAYEGVWQQVSKDLPIIYLWTPRNIVGLSAKVEGFTFLADGLLRLQDVRPARAAGRAPRALAVAGYDMGSAAEAISAKVKVSIRRRRVVAAAQPTGATSDDQGERVLSGRREHKVRYGLLLQKPHADGRAETRRCLQEHGGGTWVGGCGPRRSADLCRHGPSLF
jgi:peptide/nickel transport system substrate-binding protein